MCTIMFMPWPQETWKPFILSSTSLQPTHPSEKEHSPQHEQKPPDLAQRCMLTED